MTELFKIDPWIIYLPSVALLLIVVVYRFVAKYGHSKVRCPNCKAFDSCMVEHEGRINTATRTAVSRQGIPHEVEYKRFKLLYTCTSCDHKWEAIENHPS